MEGQVSFGNNTTTITHLSRIRKENEGPRYEIFVLNPSRLVNEDYTESLNSHEFSVSF